MAGNSVKTYIEYYRDKLDRCKDNEEMTLETLHKLGKPVVNAEVIEETGILSPLHRLFKCKGKVAETALHLYNKWKKLLRDKAAPKRPSPPKERPTNDLVHAWVNNVAAEKGLSSTHPNYRGSNLDPIHPDRSGSIKRKDPFPLTADPKRPYNTYPKQKEHQPQYPSDARPHRSTNSEHYGKNSMTKNDFFAPDESSSRHPKRDSFAPDGELSRHSAGKKDYFPPDDYSSRHPASRKDSLAPDDYSSRHPASRKDSLAPDDYLSRHPASRKDSLAPDDYSSRHPASRKDSFAPDDHPASRKDRFAPDRLDSSRHSMHEPLSPNGHSSRLSMPKRDSFVPPDGDSSNHSASKKTQSYPDDAYLHGSYPHRRRHPQTTTNETSRKKLFVGESNWSRDKGTAQKVVMDTEGGQGHSAIDGKSKHPVKDYFTPDDFPECLASKSSESNGVTNSQEIDIDSLSNPNLNIDTNDRLNTSDESEHASPTKRARAREPYYIEMKEGMFRAVKKRQTNNLSRMCEMYYREMIKGSPPYKRDRLEKPDEQKKNDSTHLATPPMSPPEEENGKNSSAEKKSSAEKSGRYSAEKNDKKRKSGSNPSDSCKKLSMESTSDSRLKIKKEVLSPSQSSKAANHMDGHQSNCDRIAKNAAKTTADSASEATAMQYISSKKDRRAVYSGRKTASENSLKSSCIRVIRKNIDHIPCSKNVPYEVLHPILETLNPSQLSKIEENNRHLLAFTNNLWRQHYTRDHRSHVVGKNDADVRWKEEYERAQEQKRKKLKNLTASINAAASKAKPDRQAKVVESHHDFGRRGTRVAEVSINNSKGPTPSTSIGSKSKPVSSPGPSIGSKSKPNSSPNMSFGSRPNCSSSPKASSSVPKTVSPVAAKPKETKHSATHRPAKKVVAPLMNKVKKTMAVAYSRQK